ncbi:DMT family transporter [archaeon]|nr:MAG: DMT family transporter [archaeon]
MDMISPLHQGILLFVFVFTGVLAPLLIEWITLSGGCEKSTLLVMLPGNVGMLSAYFVNNANFSKGTIKWKYVAVIAFLELISQFLIFDGLMLAGSAIYTVAYSSVTIYTAILAMFFLNKKLHYMQWLGIIIIAFGLAVVSIGAQADGSDVLTGVCMILLGSVSHACTYVVTEYVLVYTDDPISPERLCFVLGLFASSLNLSWQVLYTRQHFHTLVVEQITLHNGNPYLIACSYIVLTIIAGIHAVTFYQLLGSIGSVSTGVCKGVQSVAIFIGSHFVFCSVQHSQCFSATKGCSLVMVTVGVVLYSTYKLDHYRYSSMDSMESMRLYDDEDYDTERRSFLLSSILRLSNSGSQRYSNSSNSNYNNIGSSHNENVGNNVFVTYQSVEQRRESRSQPQVIELPVIHHSLTRNNS